MSSNRKEFNEFLKTSLNSAQHEAVTHKEGPLLIVAGAGSGKTRVITTRITHLILNEEILPSRIIALTFTNKAALEMKERMHRFLDRTQDIPFVGTFHSFCLRLLKKHGDLLESPFISILDEDDQHKILHNIIIQAGLQKKMTAKNLAYQISQIKNQTVEPLQDQLFSLTPMIREAFAAYEKEKKASRCLDFDDLLLETVKMFKKHAEFRKEFQERMSHILVDEYQDTNVVQHELLRQMALSPKKDLALDSLCAVGDEDQSIYSWRGATVSNILNFSKDFPGTKIIKVEQNYRSVQPILHLANQVIQNNTNRNPKNLWSEKAGSDRIRLLAFLSEYQEAETIAQFLKVAAKKQKLSTIAILYRTHFQSRALEEAFVKNSIPYKIIGGIQFYERKEIKDMLAYLKLVANPFDRASLFRVINCPLRGLGSKFEELFALTWNTNLFATFKEIATQLISSAEVTGGKKDALMAFVKLFETMLPTEKPSSAAQKIINQTAYFSYLKETYDPEEAMTKIDNVKELLKAIDHLESQGISTITDFLDEVALMQAQVHEDGEQKDPVLLMTLHAAKGLEFDTVILTGLEEGLLPSARSLSFEESIEEERRLLYVGITRAQERLLLTYCRYRYHYGTMTDQRPSRFVQEIPKGTVTGCDASYWNAVQTTQFFSEWVGGKEKEIAQNIPRYARSDYAKASTDKSGGFYPEPAEGRDERSENPFVVSASKTSVPARHSSEGATAGSNHHDIPSRSKPAQGIFKKNQPVSHEKFGVGIVQDIELRANGATYLQIKFKSGIKKLDANFVIQK